MRRSVFKLRITCDSKYVTLLDRCQSAMSAVVPNNKVSRATRVGCTDVYSHSKHWPCLFPQHGLGKKHNREIKLEPWQQALVDIDPRPLVEGLLHSDGCRVINTVRNKTGKSYNYTNVVPEARQRIGIEGEALQQRLERHPQNLYRRS